MYISVSLPASPSLLNRKGNGEQPTKITPFMSGYDMHRLRCPNEYGNGFICRKQTFVSCSKFMLAVYIQKIKHFIRQKVQ